MTRLAPDDVARHLEVSISDLSPALVADLQHADRYRRAAAVSTLARHLADRMRGYEITSSDPIAPDHPSLF